MAKLLSEQNCQYDYDDDDSPCNCVRSSNGGAKMTFGTSIYEVRSGWGEGVPKKQTNGTGLREFCTRQGGEESNLLRTSYMEAPFPNMDFHVARTQVVLCGARSIFGDPLCI